MANPLISENWADARDPAIVRMYTETYNALPDMLPQFFTFDSATGHDTIKWSQAGAISDMVQWAGSVNYDSAFQGYDTTATYLQFTQGIQIERALHDDDVQNVIDSRPRALAGSVSRTRQKHGAAMFNGAFNTASIFYNNSEAVAMCSDSHTNTSGASTANGFDNKLTSALSAVAVAAGRIQMVDFRGDRAERISVVPDEILVPPNLYEVAYEIVESRGKVDTANNNANVHEGAYKVLEWNYLNDTSNWFMMDSTMRNLMLHWVDKVAPEMARMEDFDSLVLKHRVYARYASAHTDWRFILGAEVS